MTEFQQYELQLWEEQYNYNLVQALDSLEKYEKYEGNDNELAKIYLGFAHGSAILMNKSLENIVKVKQEAQPKKIGRPSLGVTSRVSVTMSTDLWDFVDRYCSINNVSKSEFFREAVKELRGIDDN